MTYTYWPLDRNAGWSACAPPSRQIVPPHDGFVPRLLATFASAFDFGSMVPLLESPAAQCRQVFTIATRAAPAMDELRSAFLRVYEELPEAASQATDVAMGRENPYEPARRPFPRAGDFAGYLMSGHFGYHVGQLSAWRAGAGLPVLGTE